MQDLPDPASLVALAASFLRAEIMPLVEGAPNFQLRVAINALDLAARELRHAATTGEEEHARLVALLGYEGSLEDLNRAVCRDIADGAMTRDTPGLAAHLWATTLAKLAVDQPNYAAYSREVSRNDTDASTFPDARTRDPGSSHSVDPGSPSAAGEVA